MTDNPRIRPPASADKGVPSRLRVVQPLAPAAPARTVVIVVWDGVRMLDVAGPLEVFAVADPASERYVIRTTSVGGRSVATVRGPSLGVDVALEDIDGNVDTLLVAGGLEYRAAAADPELIAEVRRLAVNARRVVSVCTGAFVLAAAGQLDGRRATTHWARCDELAAKFANVSVEQDAIFVRDGRVSTSAGVTAGIDLALALVEEDHGIDVARQAAKSLVVFMQRPGGQSQFSVRSHAANVRHESLRRVLDEITRDPTAHHSASTMAETAAMSLRHFTRLFTEEIGVAPARYVEQVRVEAAKALLELGDDGLDVISRRCGFRSPETMRRAFLRVMGVPPGSYRRRFGRPAVYSDPQRQPMRSVPRSAR
jgi:transcriptional regulator GlxA family with amidase domain